MSLHALAGQWPPEFSSGGRHVVLGALAGGAVGGGLAVGLAHGCESNKAIGPSCAIGKLLVVGLSTAMGAIVGAVGGYFWPTRVSP